MTELIGPKPEVPEGPEFVTPLKASPEGRGIQDANGRLLATIPLSVRLQAQGVAPALAEAANAYYGGLPCCPHAYQQRAADSDARIEGLEDTHEREVYNLYEEIHRQANTIEEKNARIDELEMMVSRVSIRAADKAMEAAELEERLERAQRDYEIAGENADERAVKVTMLQRSITELEKDLEFAIRRAEQAESVAGMTGPQEPREPKVGDRVRVVADHGTKGRTGRVCDETPSRRYCRGGLFTGRQTGMCSRFCPATGCVYPALRATAHGGASRR